MACLKWTEGNSKLTSTSGASSYRILGYGIPADYAFERDGYRMNTCPSALACRGVCYAKQGRYTMPNVAAARRHNLDTYLADRDAFIAGAIADLAKYATRYNVVRVHDSGDFFEQDYLDAWATIARAHPGIIFYAYTKSLDLSFTGIPSNLRITQSVGGRHDALIDPDFSHARIFADTEEAIATMAADGYVDGSESDVPAIEGLVRIGLVYHGTRKMTDAQKLYFS